MAPHRAAVLAALAVLALLLPAGPPLPAAAEPGTRVLVVDDDTQQCPDAAFSSVQGAVSAARAGDVVRVCPGLYRERVDVDRSLTLLGDPEAVTALECAGPAPAPDPDPARFAILQPPDEGTYANAVDVLADDVRVAGLVVQGAVGFDGVDRYAAAIATAGDTSGVRIDHNLLQRSDLGLDTGGDGERSNRYDHNCLRDDEFGVASQTSSLVGARIDHNELVGQRVLAFEVGWYAASVSDTRIDHNRLVGGRDGVVLGLTRDVVVEHNEVVGGARGVVVLGGNTAPVVRHNRMRDGATFGILFSPLGDPTTDAVVEHNVVTGYGAGSSPAAGTGIGVARTAVLGSVDGLRIEHNTLTGNGLVGISVQPLNPDVVVVRNVADDNGTWGVYARPGTTGVRFERNAMTGNGLYDAADDGAGNVWLRNRCVTDDVGGAICG